MLSVAGGCFTPDPAKVPSWQDTLFACAACDERFGHWRAPGGRKPDSSVIMTRDRGSVVPYGGLDWAPMEPTVLLSCLEDRSRTELRPHFTEQSKSCHLVILPGTQSLGILCRPWYQRHIMGAQTPCCKSWGLRTTPAQCSGAAELCCSLAPNSRGREWLECKSVIYEENTQLHAHVKSRNSLTSGHKPTTNFLYAQVIPYLFVLGVLVPFPQASGVCLS